MALSVLGACTADEPAIETETIQVSMLIQQEGQGPQWFRDVEVTKGMDDDGLQGEIADGVRIVVAKGTISNVVSRGQPVKEPPTRSAGKKRPAARRTKSVETEEPEESEEPEEDWEGEEDASSDDEAEAETDEENEEEPEKVENRPTPKKRSRKNAAS